MFFPQQEILKVTMRMKFKFIFPMLASVGSLGLGSESDDDVVE